MPDEIMPIDAKPTPPGPEAATGPLAALIARAQGTQAAPTSAAPAAAQPSPRAPQLQGQADELPPEEQPVVAPPVEGQPATPSLEDEELKRIAWGDIVRRDRELVERSRRSDADTRELEEYRALKQSRDPSRAIQLLGLDHNAVLDAIVNRGAPQPTEAAPVDLAQKVQQLERTIDHLRIEQTEQAKIRAAIASSDAELVRMAAESGGDQVLQEILQEAANHFVSTGARMSYAEAVKKVEEKYEVQSFALLESLGRSKKVREKLGALRPQTTAPAQATDPQAGTVAAPMTRQAPPTLTNAMTQTPPTTKKPHEMSDAEKRAAFVEAIRGGWKTKENR